MRRLNETLRSRGLGATALVLASVVTLLILAPWAARADSSVTVTASCTLPIAVAYADGTVEPSCAPGVASGTTTINLPQGTYTLTGTLSLTAATILTGAGASSTTITGNHAVQVLSVASGVTAAVSGVTITGGVSGVSSAGCTPGTVVGMVFYPGSCPLENGLNGGGISTAGTLTLTGSVITGNATSAGTPPYSGRFNLCPLFISCAASAGQSAGDGGEGAGIYNSGALTLQATTVSNNATGDGGTASSGTSGTNSDASAGQNGGNGGLGGAGGGIDNNSGATLTVMNSTISGNTNGAGGSGGNGSAATEANGAGGSGGSGGNGGVGGGIANSGTFTVSNSTIANNSTGPGGAGGADGAPLGAGAAADPGYGGEGGSGGAIWSFASTTNALTDTTLTSNATGAGGSGVNSSYSGDGGDGGALYNGGFGSLIQLSFITVADNSATGGTGGLRNDGGAVTEADSVVASNSGTTAKNCSTANITDDGNNLVFGDFSCPGLNADPKLGALQDNGGPTQTMALQSGSAAIDRVPLMSCPLTVDQRGVSRPQGPGCDAGAYELAPPAITGVSGTSASQTGGLVTASITPNESHADTTVVLDYGTSTTYGSATTPQDFGRGVTPASFSADLTGLSASTLYHFQIVATNADGTTKSSDGTFTTATPPPPPPALSAAIDSAAHAGTALNVNIACGGGSSGAVCSGNLTLTAHVSTQGTKVVAITAEASAKPKPKPKPKPKTKTKTKTKTVVTKETVGSGTYSIATGKSQVVTLRLNPTGLKLLAARYKLPTTLTMTGTVTATRTLTFSYSVIKSPIGFTWAFGPHTTTVQALSVSAIPSGAKVLVSCHGGGCPFARHTFTPKRGKVSLTSAFKTSKLKPKATVEVQVTHPGDVSKVAVFTMRAGAEPKLVESCLVPGAKRVSACVR